MPFKIIRKFIFYKKSNFLIPNPKPLPRGEGLCMLSWLCIVQSVWAYTPGVRAGLSVGLPPSPRLGLRPKPRFV